MQLDLILRGTVCGQLGMINLLLLGGLGSVAGVAGMAGWQPIPSPPARLGRLPETAVRRGRPPPPTLGSDSPNPQKVPLLCCFAGVDWATTLVFRLRFLCRIQIHGGVAGLVLVYAPPPSFSQSASASASASIEKTNTPSICCSLDFLTCRAPGPNTACCLLALVFCSLPSPSPAVLREIPTRHSDPFKPRRCSRQP